MNLLLGLPEQTVLIVDTSFVNQQVDAKTFTEYQQEALQNRKDVQAVGFQQRAAELATKSAKAENLPTLALTGGYVAADIPNFLTVTNAVNAGVGIQYNLANLWKSNAVLKQSRARETQLLASRELLIDGIKLEINRDYQNAFVAKRKLRYMKKQNARPRKITGSPKTNLITAW